MTEIKLPDYRDWFERKRHEILDSIKGMSTFHWIRLGICFGLLRWFDFAERMIIAGRGVEKAMTIYQMGVIDRDNGTSMISNVGDIYVQSFVFESVGIIIVGFVLWLLLLKYFGFPKKLFGKNPDGVV